MEPLVSLRVIVLTPRGNSMTISEISAYRAHVTHCCSQSSLAKDDRLKKYWDDLADNWISLENAVIERDKL